MELPIIKNGLTESVELGLNVDQLKPSAKPVDIERAKIAFEQVKSNLDNVESSDKPSEQDVSKIAEQLNSLTKSLNIELHFSVEQRALGIIRIQMIDSNTNQVIREIPPKGIKAVGSNLLDAAGLIIDEMA